MKSLHRMFCLFWVSTTAFQIADLFVDDFSHWYTSLGIFCMWLTLCVFSYLVNRGLKKEREILAAQHAKLMNEMKAQHQQDREERKERMTQLKAKYRQDVELIDEIKKSERRDQD